MAMANIADLLRQHGLKVIVVDGELEEPDLERYFPSQKRIGSHTGLLDLIVDFKKILSEPTEMPGSERETPLPELALPKLPTYLEEISIDDGPTLMLMPAGRRDGVADLESYAKTVRLFDWKDFYKNWEGESFFKWLKRELAKLADVVLINGGSGISEIGNICIQEMADVVVFFCGSNQQSLDGTVKVAASLIERQRSKAVDNPPVGSIVVPARIEERVEAELVSSFKEDFIKGCTPFLPPDKTTEEDYEYFWNLRVPNVPRFTFTEGLMIRTPGGEEESAYVTALTKVLKAMARLAPRETPLHKLSDDAPAAIPNPQPRLPEGIEPYRGLSPFLEEHFALFFGRAAEIKELLGYVNKGGLVAVIGQSGSGKSSLVQAGLLPRVRRGNLPGSEHWEIIILRPGDDPFEAVFHSFAPLLREAGHAVDNSFARVLAEETDAFAGMVNQVLKDQPAGARVLLILDQFEELFTLAPEDQQQPFLMSLLAAVEKSPLTAVITLRSDFHNECQQYDLFYAAMNRQTVNITQMSRANLKESVIRPAELMGVTFEAGLADRIMDDVGTEPGSLPLLQFALTRLWEGSDKVRLTHQVYADIGGVQAAVAQRAETIYEKLTDEKKEIARRIFTQLVQLNEGDRNTRRQRTYAELGEPADEVRDIVKLLSDARLLVVREVKEEAS
jgi:energy-coupling factor transporter ATP-binding protein EcfA2